VDTASGHGSSEIASELDIGDIAYRLEAGDTARGNGAGEPASKHNADESASGNGAGVPESNHGADESVPDMRAARVSEILRGEGFIADHELSDQEPDDVTQEKFMFPASRSVRLQTLFRADTGFVSGVAYAGMRGYGFNAHPTIGELRCGYVEIAMDYPYDGNESMVLGEILFTEVEGFTGDQKSSEKEHDELGIAIGYGLAFGRQETKAIAMSILDSALNHPHPGSPPNDEEFVLLHGEALEMSGFISHLKLPHYVTYQSKLDNIRKTRRKNASATDGKV
jgi:alpha-D-ribose 1-methylphosphonate 5-triphosphate synthase subunit PhnI